jgi:threonine dehydratase
MQYPQPKIEHIYAARQRIQPLVRKTPIEESPWLTDWLHKKTFLKLENRQITGSFKIRGATNKLLNLSDDEKSRGVITVSSGNHGRAVSYVASQLGINAVICLSETVPPNKVQAIQQLGAETVVAGKTYDESAEHAALLQEQRGLIMVHPFDDPFVIAGQGTIGVELIEDSPHISTVIVPLSGGGLLGGIALALKSLKPDIHIVGVSMESGPAMVESLKAGQVVDVIEEPTLADALAGGIGLDNCYTFRLIQELVDETVLVSEEEIAAAMTFALERHHLVVEGGGAVGIAALLYTKIGQLGENVAVVLSGANVNLPVLLQVAQGSYPYQEETS